MGRPSRFSPEVRERAVRMVEEHREAHASEWAVLQSVAPKLGCTAETLRKWVRFMGSEMGRLVFVRIRELVPKDQLSPDRSHTMLLDPQWVATISVDGRPVWPARSR